MAPVSTPSSSAEAQAALAEASCVVNFCASWCEPCVHMNTVFGELAAEHSSLRFVQVKRRRP